VIGIDLVDPCDAARLAAPRLRGRIFTRDEAARTRTADLPVAFAAKEALLKALGWGIERGVARFAEIEVSWDGDGALVLRTRGRVRDELVRRGLDAAGLVFAVGQSRGAVVVLARAEFAPAPGFRVLQLEGGAAGDA
jgi:phosphopantetheinyl transferase (holo-ACP synthase)